MANQQYYSIFTEQGLSLLRESIQNGTKLGITHMSFGDGNGMTPNPDASFSALINEVYRTPLNRLAPTPQNENWLEADAVIPSAVGGFNIREVGLWAENIMVAYANYPATYKPSADQGTAQIKTIRIVLQIDNTANFELKIDASVVMATVQYVEDMAAKKIDFVNNYDDLKSLTNMKDGQVIYVKSIAKNFIYTPDTSETENGVTVIEKWVMDRQEQYYASWFATANLKVSQTLALQIGFDYATSKNAEFIVDKPFWVSATSTDAWTMQPNNKQCVVVKSNSRMRFINDGKLCLIPTDLPHYNILSVKENATNFEVWFPVLYGDLDEHTFAGTTTHEWGHGLTIPSCSNGLIYQPKIYKCVGDGIYINRLYWSNFNYMPKDISIIQPEIDAVRRNGISLCGAEDLYIDTPIIKNVKGTGPNSSIDIEPEQEDGHTPSTLKRVKINNFSAIDCGTALNIALGSTKANTSTYEADVTFTGVTKFEGCKRQFVYAQFYEDHTEPYDLNANIVISEAHVSLTKWGNLLEGNAHSNVKNVTIKDLFISTTFDLLTVYCNGKAGFNTSFNSLNIDRIHLDSKVKLQFNAAFSEDPGEYEISGTFGLSDDVHVFLNNRDDPSRKLIYAANAQVGGFNEFSSVTVQSEHCSKITKLNAVSDGVGNFVSKVILKNNDLQWKTFVLDKTDSSSNVGIIFVVIDGKKYGCNVIGGRFSARMINNKVEFKESTLFSVIP